MLDRILTFLFRKKMGLILLLGSVCCSAFIMSGCFSWSMLSCFCDNMGCDGCADCYAACDQMCSCNTGCEPIDCMFGNGCVTECGNCGQASCGGCNSTLFTSCEDDNCEGACDSCVMSCSNYEFVGTKTKENGYEFTLRYDIKDSQGRIIDSSKITKSFYRSEAEGGSPDEVTIGYEKTIDKEYFNLIRIIDEKENVIETDGSSLVFNTKDWKDDVFDMSAKVTFIVEEKGYGEAVDVVVKYRGVDKADEHYSATVGASFPVIEKSAIEGYTFKEFYYFTEPENTDANKPSEKVKTEFTGEGTISLYKFKITPNENNRLVFVVYAEYAPIEYVVDAYKYVDGKKVSATQNSQNIAINVDYGKTVSDVITTIKKKNPDLGVDTEGYKFICWAYDPNGERVVNENSAEKITSFLKLYCIYKSKVVVTFKNTVKPGEGEQKVVALFGDKLGNEIKIPQPPVNGKYSFLCWCLDEALTQELQIGQLIEKNMTLYAKWQEQDIYQARFYKDLESYNNNNPWSSLSRSFNYKDGLTLPDQTSVVAVNGYTFEGWRIINADGTATKQIYTALEKGIYERNVNFVAVYSRKVKLVVSPSEGTVSGTTDFVVYYGESFDLPVATPTVAGKEFAYWTNDRTNPIRITDNKGHGDKFDLVIEDASQTTYLAPIWSNSSYTVRFVVDGIDNTVVSSIEHGNTIPTNRLPSDPVKTGYNFDGWYNGSNRFDPNAPVTSNVSYTAKWSPKTYTITLMNSDGSLFAEKTVKYGEKINLGVPSNTGKIFIAWRDISNKEWSDDRGNMTSNYALTENVTLYAFEI